MTDSGTAITLIGCLIAIIIILRILKRIRKYYFSKRQENRNQKIEAKRKEQYLKNEEERKQQYLKDMEERILIEHKVRAKIKKEELKNCRHCGAPISKDNNQDFCIYCNTKLI